MKTRKIVTLLIACLLILSGCRKQISTTEPVNTPQSSTHPAKVAVATEATKSTPTDNPQENEETVAAAATETPSTEITSPPSEQKEQKSATEPTKAKPENASPTKKETEPSEPATTPSVPETTQPESEPAAPETTEPQTEPTVPVTAPTEPKPETSTECPHDWQVIHHDEKGHWKAGVICDCGWVVYGKADEVVAKWNAHSSSYPAEEALFEHGGYGSVDEWVVDQPAYDERVCRHCGETKS
jgi:hypothetical protein